MDDLGDKISWKWKVLGRRLGFDDSELARFHKHNQEDEEKCYAMLLAWKKREGQEAATYQILNEALSHHRVGRKDLAEKFCYDN